MPVLHDMADTPAASYTITLEFQTLHAQLERMRAMHYKYSELFYKLIAVGLLTIIVMAMASMTELFRATVLLIPFFTIYIGVQSAYFLSYVVFARVYATGVEQRINRFLQTDVLIGHRLEAVFLFPLGRAQFAGVPARIGQTLIGFITIHFWMLGAGIISLSTYRAWQLLPALTPQFPPLYYYLPALIAWSLLHLVYLFWYFGARRDERRIERLVAEAYQAGYESA